jgi:hypothetical protein
MPQSDSYLPYRILMSMSLHTPIPDAECYAMSSGELRIARIARHGIIIDDVQERISMRGRYPASESATAAAVDDGFIRRDRRSVPSRRR